MKYLAEYRDAEKSKSLVKQLARLATRDWSLMEVCGGQTHSIVRNGLDQMLPSRIRMIHGPGCPVCVTPLKTIDRALAIAQRSDVIFCSFGDMLRVPGSKSDLLSVRARGGDVRVVYSPLDALKIARANPDRQVVFLAIGFETTAPASAMAIKLAKKWNVQNFSALVSHVLVPPALEAIQNSPDNRVDAFLAAGHVCGVMGFHQYHAIAVKYRVPIVVTGFEPLDLLDGIRRAVSQLETGRACVENAYARVVSEEGNAAAQTAIGEVFETTDQSWRGLGVIPRSGWKISETYREYDAELRFPLAGVETIESTVCRSGDVLRGKIKPTECSAFGNQCTPCHPLGATMVSDEGACAAYYHYKRLTFGVPHSSNPDDN